MNALYLALGVSVLAAVIVDILWTTLWVDGGAGPLTSRLMAWTWRAFRRVGARDSRLLTLSGPSILVLSLVTWIASLWGGWVLIFASAEHALTDTVAARAVSWGDLFYYTGYTVFTLGNGDFIPRGTPWQVATTLASASGMLFITLNVTYVLSVLGAVTQKRAFASNVRGLGEQSADILRASWNGDEFEGLEVPLNSVASQLNTLTANHKAYPILHYFYSGQPAQAPTTSVAIFDEALTLLRFAVPEEDRPNELLLRETRSSVQSYLGTVKSAYIEPADRSPPTPDVAALRDGAVPTVSDREFAASISDLDARRRTLLGLVESDERRWPSSEETE